MIGIAPTDERVILAIHRERGDARHITDVVKRWLERMARRKGRHINEPSLALRFEYDPASRKQFVLACADSFPDTLPEWLRTTPATKQPIRI